MTEGLAVMLLMFVLVASAVAAALLMVRRLQRQGPRQLTVQLRSLVLALARGLRVEGPG